MDNDELVRAIHKLALDAMNKEAMCKSAASYDYARYFAGRYSALMDVLDYVEGCTEDGPDTGDFLTLEESLKLHGYDRDAYKLEDGDLIIRKTPGTKKIVDAYLQKKGGAVWYMHEYTDPFSGMPMYRLRKAEQSVMASNTGR